MKCVYCKQDHNKVKTEHKVKLRGNKSGGYINLPKCLIGKTVKVKVIQ